MSPMDSPRFYTIDEAQRTLPLVKRIVGDIVTSAGELKRKEAALARRESPEARDEVELLLARLKKYARELDGLGIELKDPLTGLIDYYWKRGDDTVLLCWKHGEEGIGHWHDLESGFAGRRPLDAVDFSLDAR